MKDLEKNKVIKTKNGQRIYIADDPRMRITIEPENDEVESTEYIKTGKANSDKINTNDEPKTKPKDIEVV